MNNGPNIARIGVLIGDNTRAAMLSALMSGKALTATELARTAGITQQTASSHLAKLHDGGLLCVRKQGRHKYFALASQSVADLLASLMSLSADADPAKLPATGPKDQALRRARVCYKHLAGDMGVQMYDALLADRYLIHRDGNLMLSSQGRTFITNLGIDLDSLQSGNSPLCRECLDWSERRSHLAGSLGRALFARFVALRWMSQESDSRIVRLSIKGERQFNDMFNSGRS